MKPTTKETDIFEVLERLQQAMLRLTVEDLKGIAYSDVFNVPAMDQITRHFEYVVERNAEIRRADLRS